MNGKVKKPEPQLFVKQTIELRGIPARHVTIYKVTKMLNTTEFFIGGELTKKRIDELVEQRGLKVTIS